MRTRLNTEQRRSQLLGIGAKLFATRPYEQVSMEEVAKIAHTSCGLLYHYFPSKWAFFTAVAEQADDRLLHNSAPDPALTPLDRIKAGLEVYIDYAEQNPDSFRLNEQTTIAEKDRDPYLGTHITPLRNRILATLGQVVPVDNEIQMAVTGWLAFTHSALLDWLDKPSVSREQLREMCLRTLCAAVGLELRDEVTAGS